MKLTISKKKNRGRNLIGGEPQREREREQRQRQERKKDDGLWLIKRREKIRGGRKEMRRE